MTDVAAVVELVAFTPVTTPPDVIVATPTDADVHGFTAAGVPEPISVVVPFLHIVNVPLIVGNEVTVNVNVD